MSKLGTLSDKDNSLDAVWYKVLSFLSGEDLKKVERKKLRQNRKRTVEMEDNDGPAPRRKPELQAIIAAGLNEAELMENFNPDLLIVTKLQYKELFDIGAGSSIGVEKFAPLHGRTYTYSPPQTIKLDGTEIETTYSDAADGMLLVESDSL